MPKESRLIGIRHRVKRTAEGESHPTQVAIWNDGRFITYELEKEQDELDFVYGRFPVKYREAMPNDNIESYQLHHLKLREIKADDQEEHPPTLVLKTDKKSYRVTRVPEQYDGLRPNDTVAMMLGGTGNNLAYALSRRGLDIKANVYRVPPHVLKDFRGDDKENDAKHLAELFQKQSAKFYHVGKRDRNLIRVQETFRLREEAMKNRIAVEQRLYSVAIGDIFCSEEGLYPEGEITKLVDEKRVDDAVYQSALKIERQAQKQLTDALNHLPVYTQLFSKMPGVGPAIAARIIATVGDIRLFWEATDEERMAELFDEADQIERQYYDPIKAQIKSQVKDMDVVHRLGVVFTHYRRLDNRVATNAITRATECHKERAELKRKATRAGQSNLKAFLGVHLVLDEHEQWVFPRKKRGARCNWNPTGRQAIYLLDDQMVKHKNDQDVPWAAKREGFKQVFRERHPEVVKVEVNGKNGKPKMVSRYTPGHIHNMARWRFGTRWVEWLFVEWTKLELAHAGGEQ